MQTFKISVVIPSYNSGPFLVQAVDSILRQSGDFELMEIIVVDDQSTDPAMADIYASLRQKPRIAVIENNGPKGVSAARNKGVSVATGNWIAFLDADDVLVEGSLGARCDAARLFPDCEWIGGDFSNWYGGERLEYDGLRLVPEIPLFLRRAFEIDRPVRLKRPVDEFLDYCMAATGTILVSARLLKLVGPFSNDLRRAEDHQLYVRLAALSDFVFVPRILLLYRHHANNVTGEDAPPHVWTVRAFQQLLDDFGFERYRRHIYKQYSVLHLSSAYYYRTKRQFKAALTSSLLSVRYDASRPEAWKCLAASLLRR